MILSVSPCLFMTYLEETWAHILVLLCMAVVSCYCPPQ